MKTYQVNMRETQVPSHTLSDEIKAESASDAAWMARDNTTFAVDILRIFELVYNTADYDATD